MATTPSVTVISGPDGRLSARDPIRLDHAAAIAVAPERGTRPVNTQGLIKS